jgi:hypothetical protein
VSILFESIRITLAQILLEGRIKHNWKAWRLISADPWILGFVREGFTLELESPPVVWVVSYNAGMSEVQLAISREDTRASLHQKGAFRIKTFSWVKVVQSIRSMMN